MCLYSLLVSSGIMAQFNDSLPATPGPSNPAVSGMLKASVAPAALLTTGILIQTVSWPLSNKDINKWTKRNFGVIDNNYDNYIQWSPVIMAGGLRLAGVKGKNTLFDEAALLFISIGIQGVLVHFLKNNIAVQRPDQLSFDAFPSGHTSQAFTNATFMHMEYGELSPWYSVAAYSPAAATGAYRILRNRHWASDVLVGAACGIIVTRAVYWAYPKVKEKIRHMLIKRNPRYMLQ